MTFAMAKRSRTSAPCALICFVLLVFTFQTEAFYVPGVHPVDFTEDQLVSPKVGRVSSVRKHVPYDYYDLPHCEPQDGVRNFNANIGEVLRYERPTMQSKRRSIVVSNRYHHHHHLLPLAFIHSFMIYTTYRSH